MVGDSDLLTNLGLFQIRNRILDIVISRGKSFIHCALKEISR